jgi:hypothetical protein
MKHIYLVFYARGRLFFSFIGLLRLLFRFRHDKLRLPACFKHLTCDRRSRSTMKSNHNVTRACQCARRNTVTSCASFDEVVLPFRQVVIKGQGQELTLLVWFMRVSNMQHIDSWPKMIRAISLSLPMLQIEHFFWKTHSRFGFSGLCIVLSTFRVCFNEFISFFACLLWR